MKPVSSDQAKADARRRALSIRPYHPGRGGFPRIEWVFCLWPGDPRRCCGHACARRCGGCGRLCQGAVWRRSSIPGPSYAAQRHARPVPIAAISPLMREALVATEDERFYHHRGVDLIGLLRAIPYDVSHLSSAQGASTITEQLAKTLYLSGDDHSLAEADRCCTWLPSRASLHPRDDSRAVLLRQGRSAVRSERGQLARGARAGAFSPRPASQSVRCA